MSKNEQSNGGTPSMRESCNALAKLLVAVKTAAEIGIIAFGKWEATRDVVHRAAVPLAQLERQLAGEPLVPSDDEIREENWQRLTEAGEAYDLSLTAAIDGIAMIRSLATEIKQDVSPQQWRNNLRSALQRLEGDRVRHGHQLFGEQKDSLHKFTAEILDYSYQLRGADVPDIVDAPTSKGGGGKRTSRESVRKQLEGMRCNGDSWPGYTAVEEELRASRSTIHRAISESPALTKWAKQNTPRTMLAQPLNDVVADNAEQYREPPPDEMISDEEVQVELSRLRELAGPEERATINTMDKEGQRLLALQGRSQHRDPEPSPLEDHPSGRTHYKVKSPKRA